MPPELKGPGFDPVQAHAAMADAILRRKGENYIFVKDGVVVGFCRRTVLNALVERGWVKLTPHGFMPVNPLPEPPAPTDAA